MDDRHPTYPARTSASGAWVWIAFGLAVLGAAGFVITLLTNGHYSG